MDETGRLNVIRAFGDRGQGISPRAPLAPVWASLQGGQLQVGGSLGASMQQGRETGEAKRVQRDEHRGHRWTGNPLPARHDDSTTTTRRWGADLPAPGGRHWRRDDHRRGGTGEEAAAPRKGIRRAPTQLHYPFLLADRAVPRPADMVEDDYHLPRRPARAGDAGLGGWQGRRPWPVLSALLHADTPLCRHAAPSSPSASPSRPMRSKTKRPRTSSASHNTPSTTSMTFLDTTCACSWPRPPLPRSTTPRAC